MKVLISWSSGKDSAWTLYALQQEGVHQIAGLLTTVNSAFSRVAMHGTRQEILAAQARATGLPLWEVPLPWPCSNAQYEAAMASVCARAVAEGIEAIAFGDLFLADVRAYRERMLAGTGLQPLFPLWGRDTAALVRDMLAAGLRARIVCLDPAKLPPALAGRDLDDTVLDALPPEADPCAENGEFHTCVYAGPMFRYPLDVQGGPCVERDGFVYADLHLTSSLAATAPSA